MKRARQLVRGLGFDCRGYTRWIVLASIVLFVAIAAWIAWESRPSRMVAKKHAALVAGIENGRASRVERLLSQDYKDRWGFNREDATSAMSDVGRQFMVLVIQSEDLEISIDGDVATVTAHFEVAGTSLGPIGNQVIRSANRLKKPFVFTWKKQSFLPASWRLIKMEQEEIPDSVYGYEPGMF